MKKYLGVIIAVIIVLVIFASYFIIFGGNQERGCQGKFGKEWHAKLLNNSWLCADSSGQLRIL